MWALFTASLVICCLDILLMNSAAFVRTAEPNLADGTKAMAYIFDNWLPMGLRGVALAIFFTTSLTVIGSQWNTTASWLAHDSFRLIYRREPSSTDLLKLARWMTIGIAVVSLGITFLWRSLLDGLYLAVIFRFCLNFGVIFGLTWWRANSRTVWIVTAIGLAGALYVREIMAGQGGIDWIPFMNLHLNVIVFAVGIVLAFLIPTSKEELQRKIKFFKTVGEPWVGKKQFRKALQETPAE
jgi:Na+/proline symporter